MGTSKKSGAFMHGVLHQLPGMPVHDQAADLNSNPTAALLHHRSLPSRPLRNRPLPNRPLQSLDGHHGRPPRVLAGWQAWIGRLFGEREL